jgi:hypothetical protein
MEHERHSSYSAAQQPPNAFHLSKLESAGKHCDELHQRKVVLGFRLVTAILPWPAACGAAAMVGFFYFSTGFGHDVLLSL